MQVSPFWYLRQRLPSSLRSQRFIRPRRKIKGISTWEEWGIEWRANRGTKLNSRLMLLAICQSASSRATSNSYAWD